MRLHPDPRGMPAGMAAAPAVRTAAPLWTPRAAAPLWTPRGWIAARGPWSRARIELARRQGLPTGVAVRGERVFWANQETGTVVSCPTSGCPESGPTMLASGQSKPTGIGVNGEFVFWVAEAGAGMFSVLRCPLAGCGAEAPVALLSDSGTGYGLAVSEAAFYVAAGERLLRCPLAGCMPATAEVLVTGKRISGVAVNATHFYYTRLSMVSLTSSTVFRCPVAGCGPRSADEDDLGGSGVWHVSVAIDERAVYWTESKEAWAGVPPHTFWTNRVNRCPIAGCQPYAPSTITSGEISPWGIAVDANYFYWSEYWKGRIIRTSKPRL